MDSDTLPATPLATPPATPQSVPGMAVPAGLFAPNRRIAFTLLDAIGDPTEVDHAWLEDCADETVYVAPADAPAFHDYLRVYLPDILTTDAVPLADRIWAVHRALAHEVGVLYAGGGDRPRPNTFTTVCRHLATFMIAQRDPGALPRPARQRPAPSAAPRGGDRDRDGGYRGRGRAAHTRHTRDPRRRRRLRRHRHARPAGGDPRPARGADPDRAQGGRATPRGVAGTDARARHRGARAQVTVRSHHERWDGEGYPGRLAGGEIPPPPPPEARYVALADTYATLTVARRGAPRLSGGDALCEMAGSTGQFDPDLLRILVHLLAGSARVDCAARDEGA